MYVVESGGLNIAVSSSGNPDAERLALILPGLGHGKDRPHIASHMDHLALHDHLAVSLDPPGIGESGGGTEDYNTTGYLQAAKAVIDHFNRPTAVIGHSLGGRIALFAAMESPNVDSSVSLMTVLEYVRERNRDSRLVKWQTRGFRPLMADSADPERPKRLWLPYSYAEDAHSYDTPERLEGLRKLTIPKLFVGAGPNDSAVTTQEARGTYEAAGEPKQWQLLEEAGHNYWEWHGQLDRVNDLLDDFLPGMDNS